MRVLEATQPPEALAARKRALREMAERSTARVVGVMAGSGFFIDSDRLLTCAHVAGPQGAPVEVFPTGKRMRRGTVQAVAEAVDLDAALIRLERQEEDEEPQAAIVLVSTNLRDDDGFAPGFATYREADDRIVSAPGFSIRPFSFQYVKNQETLRPEAILIPAGVEVAEGLSGAAIVSESIGAVVGIVRYRRTTEAGTRGGAGTPIAALVGILDGLQELIDQPPASTNAWRTRLSELNGESPAALGIESVALEISGSPSGWTVLLDQPGATGTVSEGVKPQALGEDVGRAVFGWLSRRTSSEIEDVDRCATLLGKAAFPGVVADRLRALRGAETPFALRLKFQEGSELLDIPWELAFIPETKDPIATIKGAAVTRVAEWTDRKPREPSSDVVRVVAIVPGLGVDASADVALTQPFATTGLRQVTLLRTLYEDQLPGEFPSDRPVDVLHYVGLTRFTNRVLGVVLIDGSGAEGSMSVKDLAKFASDRGVRLLVVVSRDMPERMSRVPLASPSDYQDLLQGSLEAIVFTQFPVEASSLGAFNRVLYQHLEKSGTTIEAAVQQARSMMFTLMARQRDAAAYGAFVVLTHAGGSPFLLEPSTQRPRADAANLPGQDTRADVEGKKV